MESAGSVPVRILNGGPALDFSVLRFSFSSHGFIEQLAVIYWQGLAQSLPLTLWEKSCHLHLAKGIVVSGPVVKKWTAVWARCSKPPNDKVDILLFQVDFAKSCDHFANRNRFITLRAVNRVLQVFSPIQFHCS